MIRSVFSALILAALVFTGSLTAHAQVTPAANALAREILEELVEIPTTEAEGTARAAETLATRLRGAGFADGDVRVLGPDPRTMSLVARFRGRDERARGVLLMAHLDVVPASREDWSVDPWTFLERDGWFYGRGVGDNKAGAAMLVANFIRLKRDGWQPARNVTILLTGDEERSQNSIKWMLAEHRALIDAEVAFNTDGGGVTIRDGRPVFFDAQASEKVYADYQLEVTDKGGHSSLVRPDNPIYTLAAALSRIADHRFPLHVNDLTRLFLERYARYETGQTAIDMKAVAAARPDQAAADRLSRTPFYNAQLRTTCVATRVDAGHANNALPQHARAVVNCRILPGLPAADVEAVLRKLAGDRVTFTVIEAAVPSPPSPMPPELLGRLERLASKFWPNVPVIPTMQAGATDGMYTRSAGIPTYGVSGLDHDPDDVRAHGRDERIPVESFQKATEFWMELVRSFGDAP